MHLNGLHHRAVNAHTRNQLQSIGNTRKQVEKHRLHDPDESSGHEMIKFLKNINFPNNVYADIVFWLYPGQMMQKSVNVFPDGGVWDPMCAKVIQNSESRPVQWPFGSPGTVWSRSPVAVQEDKSFLKSFLFLFLLECTYTFHYKLTSLLVRFTHFIWNLCSSTAEWNYFAYEENVNFR